MMVHRIPNQPNPYGEGLHYIAPWNDMVSSSRLASEEVDVVSQNLHGLVQDDVDVG
jgi:hypothetical protein